MSSKGQNAEFQSFEFPSVNESRESPRSEVFAGETPANGELTSRASEMSSDFSSAIAAARAEAQAQGAAEGREQGIAESRAIYEPLFARQRDAVTAAVDSFADERRAYFRKAEGEVVRLALAIARKILHRESQIDPMLLAALVRSALDQLDRSSEVVLHVHPSQVGAWQRHFSATPTHTTTPTIVADANMQPQSCRLESSVGTTEISIDSQLGEIERGFFDLLASDPPQHESGAVQ